MPFPSVLFLHQVWVWPSHEADVAVWSKLVHVCLYGTVHSRYVGDGVGYAIPLAWLKMKQINTVVSGYNDTDLGTEKCPYIGNVTISVAGVMRVPSWWPKVYVVISEVSLYLMSSYPIFMCSHSLYKILSCGSKLFSLTFIPDWSLTSLVLLCPGFCMF